MRYFLILLISFFAWNIQAQDCASIREKLEQLEKTLSESNPQTHFEYANLLIEGSRNSCVAPHVVNKWAQHYGIAAQNGHYEASLKLGYYLQHNEMGLPRNLDQALAYYNHAVAIANEMDEQTIKEENAWTAAAMLCEIVLESFPEFMEEEGLKTAYQKYLKNFNEKESSYYTGFTRFVIFDRYLMIRGQAYQHGYFGEDKDIEKALEYYWWHEGPEAFEKMFEILDPQLAKDKANANPALALYHYAYVLNYLDDELKPDQLAIAAQAFNRLKNQIPDKATFTRKLIASGTTLFNPQNAEELNEHWDDIAKCEYVDNVGYEGWKYLSQTAKNDLYEKAKDKKLDKEDSFLVYKSMYDEGDYRSLYSLAYAYYQGQGVSENNLKARILFKEDYTRHQNGLSAYFYAYCLDRGLGGEHNWNEAVRYYELAGTTNAKIKLSEFYLFGLGGAEQNVAKAKEILRPLAAEKFSEAIRYLKVIEALETEDYAALKTTNGVVASVKLKPEDKKPKILKTGKSLSYEVLYNVPSRTGKLQLFPSQRVPDVYDEIGYSSYSPSGYYEGVGAHQLEVTNKKPYREIGYLYVELRIDGKAIDYLKIPTMTAWVD